MPCHTAAYVIYIKRDEYKKGENIMAQHILE